VGGWLLEPQEPFDSSRRQIDKCVLGVFIRDRVPGRAAQGQAQRWWVMACRPVHHQSRRRRLARGIPPRSRRTLAPQYTVGVTVGLIYDTDAVPDLRGHYIRERYSTILLLWLPSLPRIVPFSVLVVPPSVSVSLHCCPRPCLNHLSPIYPTQCFLCFLCVAKSL
jgi:hypothetical protein